MVMPLDDATSIDGSDRVTAPFGEFSAIIVAALLGEYSLLIMPFIVTAMMQAYDVTESVAGELVSLQLASMGVAGFIVSYLVRRLPSYWIVIGAALMVIGANALCALGATAFMLGVGRVVTGLGEGSLMAAAGAMAAGTRHPHRLFSVLGLVIAVTAAAALLATPILLERLGPRSVFWLLSISPVVAVLVVRWLPRKIAPSTDMPGLGALSVPGAMPILSAFALLWFGASALWVYAEQIGAAQGLSLAEVGTYLAIGQIAGVLGPIAAARFGERLGLNISIAAGSITMTVAGLMMVFGQTRGFYAGAASLLSIAVMFLAPCFRSLMAKLDATGGVIAMSVLFYTFGFGIAPLVVGVLHPSGNSYGGVAWLSAAAFAASGFIGLSIRAAHRSVSKIVC